MLAGLLTIGFRRRTIARGLVCCLGIGLPGLARAAEPDAAPVSVETNAAPATAATSNALTRTEAEGALRAFLKLQELLHAERTARAPDESTTAGSDKLAARLDAIESALREQRARDAEDWRNSNRSLLVAAVALGGAALLAVVFTSVLQWRAVSRMAQSGPSAGMPLFDPGVALPGMAPRLIGSAPAAAGPSAVGRLGQRVRELEESAVAAATPSSESDGADAAAALVGKGQTLLSLGRAEDALACFDEALKVRPANVEALLRRGAALERLRRLDEAAESYAHAAAADSSCARAWIARAGVLNQQEHFKEALDCYERALRSQAGRAG